MWDIKYRPLKFEDVLGQSGTVQVLKSRLRKGSGLDTSYIFSGFHGSGKTTLSRILSRALLCPNINLDDPEPCNQCDNCQAILDGSSLAFVEMDAASKGTVDNVRAIVDELPFAVFGAPKKIFVFDEAHRLSIGAQDVLLKPIEEKKMVAIFCTTEPEKIRGPIRSRCEEYSIRKVTREDILARMKQVLDAEKVGYEDDAVLAVIDYSHGHVRDILNRLEMIGQIGPVTMDAVREYLNLSVSSTYYDVLLSLDRPAESVALVEKLLERVQADDVSNGLAEAAMNSYRIANGLYVDSTSVDKEKAKQVAEKFGNNVIRLAEFFTRSRYGTRISLLCDILSLTENQGVPARIAPTRVTIQAAVTQPVAQASPYLVADAPTAPVQSAPKGPPPMPPMKSMAPPAPKPGVRPDGVGPRGKDPYALTDYDSEVISAGMPRGSNPEKKPELSFLKPQEDLKNDILTPTQWRMEFERTLMG